MSHPKDSRVAVVLVSRPSGRPIGLLLPDASEKFAEGFLKCFNRRMRRDWPDRKAVIVPVV